MGNMNVADDPGRGRRPATATFWKKTVNVICEEIAHEASISTASVFRIHPEIMEERKVATK
jgi:hypothetical protein